MLHRENLHKELSLPVQKLHTSILIGCIIVLQCLQGK